ncbi:MAG: hypothetical protein KBC00_00645 [Candidatus Levybacteria bacterium]|nr:hypothetical protein [Candidatus Levybacteria bacterium]MBP9814702.1 hypothetical protein [Candidatus Levybacteria bacterium]
MEKDLKKNIFLVIDGSAIVHRAYHAMPSLTTPDGIPTGAVHGFFSMLLKLMQELHPSHVAVAFDRPKPNFRKELYKEYQSQRPSMESDLSPQFQIIQDILTIAHVPVYFMDGFEADDIIGTLADKAESAGDISYIVTGDRDMMQLVDKRTKVLVPIKGISEMKLFDEERVMEHFGVLPTQIVELKALQGDASDNYPGVTGVGPKTAAGLIQSYKSVDNIYKNLEEIKTKNPKLADKLKAGHNHAILGHQLATILKNVPFDYDYKDCRVENFSHKDWRKAFESYSFKTLPKRLDEAFGIYSTDSKPKNEKNNNQMKLL